MSQSPDLPLHPVQRPLAEAARRAAMTDAPIREVLAHWDQLRQGRTLPARADLGPAALAPFASRLAMLDRRASGLWRFRLAGSTLSSRIGMEIGGMPLGILLAPSDRARLAPALEAAIAAPSIVLMRLADGAPCDAPDTLAAFLPLLDLRGEATRALLLLSPQPGNQPAAPKGPFTLRDLVLVAAHSALPAELLPRRHSILRAPVPATARVSGRRVFRVIDGGRA